VAAISTRSVHLRQHSTTKITAQIGGSARGYQELPAPIGSHGYSRAGGGQAVCLCMARACVE
jgi:hypothetical protein